MGEWLRNEQAQKLPYFADKASLFSHLQSDLVGSEPIDYLEFGVYKGTTMQMWCGLNNHPESRFFGFDSFEGLPEDWRLPTGVLRKGTYAAGGQAPVNPDPRVRFVKGLFQESLGGFLSSFKPRNRLVVHLDADLYSSTLYVLLMLNGLLKPGSLLIMDDFGSVTDVFRAFRDYQRTFQRSSRLLAGGGLYFDQAAVQVL
jgi:hypothetical protein